MFILRFICCILFKLIFQSNSTYQQERRVIGNRTDHLPSVIDDWFVSYASIWRYKYDIIWDLVILKPLFIMKWMSFPLGNRTSGAGVGSIDGAKTRPHIFAGTWRNPMPTRTTSLMTESTVRIRAVKKQTPLSELGPANTASNTESLVTKYILNSCNYIENHAQVTW